MRNNRLLLVALSVICIVITITYYLLPKGTLSNTLFDICLVVLILITAIFFVLSQKSFLRGYWLKPSNLFCIAYIAVNFQYLVDYRLGLKDNSSNYILYPEVLNSCALLGLLGFAAFVIGYFSIRQTSRINEDNKSNTRISQTEFFLITILQALVFVAFLLTIDVEAFMTGTIYGDETAVASPFEGPLYAVNSLAILQAAIRCDRSRKETIKTFLASFNVVSLVIIVAYMVLRLFSGDRGPVIYSLLLLFYAYSYAFRKKITIGATLVVLLVAMVGVSVVGIARNMDKGGSFIHRISRAYIVFTENGRFREKTIFPPTEELGFSFVVNQTDVYAVEYEGEDFNYGRYSAISVANCIPFVPRLIRRSLGVQLKDFSSTGFANYHYFGGSSYGWSIGTSVIGDSFLQFGALGVLLGLLLAGMLLALLDVVIYTRSKSSVGIYLLLFALLFSAKAIYIPRSHLLAEGQTFVQAAIILFVIRLFSGRFKS